MNAEEIDLQNGNCISEVHNFTGEWPCLSPEWVWIGFSSPALFESCLFIDVCLNSQVVACTFPAASRSELPSSLMGTESFLKQCFAP